MATKSQAEIREAVRIIACHSQMAELEVAEATVAAAFAEVVMAAVSTKALEFATLVYLAETYTGRHKEKEPRQVEWWASVEEL